MVVVTSVVFVFAELTGKRVAIKAGVGSRDRIECIVGHGESPELTR
jgi:hypothetical protein